MKPGEILFLSRKEVAQFINMDEALQLTEKSLEQFSQAMPITRANLFCLVSLIIVKQRVGKKKDYISDRVGILRRDEEVATRFKQINAGAVYLDDFDVILS